MGRCGSCRTQTQHFCFVHQEFVCGKCLTAKETIHGRCVVNTYRKWVQDSSYQWPPKCAACDAELGTDGDNIRRTCLHVEHAACVEKSTPPDYACAICKAPLQKSFDGSDLGVVIMERVRLMPALRTLLPEPPKADQVKTPEKNLRVPSTEPLGPQFQRPHAALRVSETDMGTNISRVETDDERDRPREAPTEATPVRPPLVQVRPQEQPVQTTETRIELGMPPLKNKSSNSGSYKRDKGSSRMISTSWRKTMKAGSRRLFEIRKMLGENRHRVAMSVLFIACIVMIVFLSSGEDDTATATRPVAEDVTLPHVRVNPAFVKAGESDLAHLRERIG